VLNVLIKDDPEKELARLSATNFFRDKPADETKSSYLYGIAKREAQRFGVYDYLASHYAYLAAYAAKMERKA
jgi:hypothetical protein